MRESEADMNLVEYEILHDIIKDLDTNDSEQLRNFAEDCEEHGAKQTAEYVKSCIKQEKNVDTSLAEHRLGCDFSGC